MRLLITGFEPMSGEAINASEQVVRSLDRSLPEELSRTKAEFAIHIFPTNTKMLKEELGKALENIQPDCAVFIGQARGRNKLSFERFAINLLDFQKPDGAGYLETNAPIDPNGPAAFSGTLNYGENIVEILKQHAIPAGFSNHAGTSLCNQLFYLGLQHQSARHPKMEVGFVHIPFLAEQVSNETDNIPFMPLEMLRTGLVLTLLEVITANAV